LRLFAPFLSYVTEEVWSWWQTGSVHREAWPTAEELPGDGDPGVYAVAADVLTAVRKEKAMQKVSLRAPASRVTVHDTQDRLRLLTQASLDVREAGTIQALDQEEASEFSVQTELAPVADA
jgi:valyl-tRNA synthetase